MRVEVWPTQLRLDLDDWQEALEASLSVRDNGLSYESPTMPKQSIAVPAGRYGLRVAGRGFVARGWPGSTRPGNEWRIQLWPQERPMAPRRLRRWA